MNRGQEIRSALFFAAVIATAIALVSCTASPQATYEPSLSSSGSVNPSNSSLMSARVLFDFQDFYSLSEPNASGCAGDVLNLYDPLASRNPASIPGEPAPFAGAGGAYGGTYRPSFIKNVSVDLTDTNSTAPSNMAKGCSTGPSGPSACATFDYGANEGVSSTLAGSVLLLGGIQNSNYSGINLSLANDGMAVSCGPANATFATSCGTSLYALGVNGLPASAATDPPSTLAPGLDSATSSITGFVNLASSGIYGSSSDPGPTDFIGAAGAYDPGTNEVALFGGTSVIGALSATGETATNDMTWIFNLATQSWTQVSPAPVVATTLEETFEEPLSGISDELSNIVSGRANFGYAPAQGLAVTAMSTNGTMPVYSTTGPVDSTDRLIIAGGQGGSGYLADSYKFNPTYGPEWVDTEARSVEGPTGGEATQWLVSYESVPLFNSVSSALMEPAYDAGTAELSTNFGFTALRDNNGADYGVGYPLLIGGFDTGVASGINPELDSCKNATNGSCGMLLGLRTGRAFGAAGAGSSEEKSANFLSVGNLLQSSYSLYTGVGDSGTQLTPTDWSSYTATGNDLAPVVPFYGGATVLPGFKLDTNDVVFFGGASCETYLLSTATGCSFANPGKYYTMGSDPVASGGAVPATTAMAGLSPPQRAGMAAARGTDPAGDVMIVAFGGMSAPGTGTDQTIYYLWNNAGTPTWASSTPAGAAPNVPTNGALAFSHVTKDFYLFGGYASATGTMQGDTWRLSVSPSNCASNGSCTFTWTQLDITGGTTCSPNCPAARRSHRMAEVNYSNENPGGTVGGVTSGESPCTAAAPCSYGIFMEGGTSDGVTLLDDRWMFDPTANNGYGAWQLMHEMPSRNLSSMTSVDYTLANSTKVVHRAILFGGETGMANPVQASELEASPQYYVPATLGDTWMYDFDNNTWNRVQLLGAGYDGLSGSIYNATELSNRQAYDATEAKVDAREVVGGVNHISELSPPPTAGAIMVTRTLSTLPIPEVYMVGGRLKNGSFQPLDHLYKFCVGSTGESYSNASPGLPNDGVQSSPIDFTCDAYNATTNSFSPSPSSGYVGRWLRKAPATGASLSSFMGAGAYDPVDDVIAVFGGLQFNTVDTAVTDPAQRVTQLTADATPSIYEYSFPSSANPQGLWTVMGACAGSPTPTPRYGHSMVYNSQLQALVVIGGYDLSGNPLTQSVTGASGSYSIPDMWEAVRNGASSCYTWTQINTIANSISGSNTPPMTGLSHMIAVYVPPTGYGKGYYSTYDSACAGVGPDNQGNSSQNGPGAGGVYFDIDRTQLGPHENLLLNLTFMPLDGTNLAPNGSQLPASSQAYFRIHLVQTGESESQLESTSQPRYFTYTNSSNYPEIVQTLSVIAPPTGQVQQQQILIPLTASPNIDRIRIERGVGNAILIDAALYRMGYR